MSRTMHLSAVGLVLTYCSTVSVNAFVPSTPRTVMVPPYKYGTTSSMIRSSSSTRLFFGDFFNFDKKKEEAVKEEEEESYEDAAYDDADPVEKMFSFFFGKREEAPMGMPRFGPDRFPEQYPATLDEWAEPLTSDDKEMAVLRPFLKNTNIENRGLQLTYDANRDGWDASTFHQCVDKKGGAIICCTTRMGIVTGGYNPKGWVGYGEARGSIAAFLFIVGGPYAKAGAPGIKLRKVGGAGMAQMDMPENGPSFGADSLVIPLGGNDSRLARSKLGSYYERLPDGTNSVFGKDASVQLRDLKVYHGVYEEGEYIPFTDAEPFALY
eukprot:CAMPEP_0198290620 /NCGR_PEP_ID=MMETSP1449-20131203/8415_1 /TAXON_ID=420275 /ORGANISM="Attheya septentrionalis, Strain CCMP2084" /LENGTH=323 /DNA_ID=CAMNT_0043989143 /DNA_START=82 /DNA_END=1053 /DNA_ORIENTATION=+